MGPSESIPDDPDELAIWQRVAALPELQTQAMVVVSTTGTQAYVAAVAKLRARWAAAEVAVALSLADARARARSKFPQADRLVCDRQAVEQASGAVVAGWKAARYALLGAGATGCVWDLCCGMGGDTMAFAAVRPTVAVDRSPVRAWMAGTNASCERRVLDVTDLRCPGDLVHIDPARRIEASGARSRTPFHLPPIDACLAIASSARGGAIKLGPGTDPALAPPDAALEWISERGILVQLVVWCGALRGDDPAGSRIATLLPEGISHRAPVEEVPLTDSFGPELAVPDPALERSRLLGAFARERGLAEPAAGLGIVTGHRIAPSPFLERAEILARVAPEERAVVEALRHHGAARARVRTRGGSADADQWTKSIAKRLARPGPADAGPLGCGPELDVYLLRLGSERVALIARPLA